MRYEETVQPAWLSSLENWLTLWTTIWFGRPPALAGGLPHVSDAGGGRDVTVAAHGEGAARVRSVPQLGSLTFGQADFAPDPLEELQAGCFA